MSRFITYVATIVVIGLLLSSFTRAVIEFVPFFCAGLVVMSPFYGIFRNIQNSKGVKSFATRGLKYFFGIIPRIFRMQKSSVGFYGTLAIVVFLLYQQIVMVAIRSAIMSVITMAGLAFVWELTRAIVRIAKKVEIMSFAEAVKAAF